MTATTAASATPDDDGPLTSTRRRSRLKRGRPAQRREGGRATARSLGASVLAVGLTLLLSVPTAPAVTAGGSAVGKLAPPALWMTTLASATEAAAETSPVPEADGLVGDGTGESVVLDEILNSSQYPVQWPFEGPVRISSDFGPRVAPCSGCSSYHRGTDFLPGDGAPVYAIADGVVRLVSGSGGLGVHVVIEHVIDSQMITSTYAHMQVGSVPLVEGQMVGVGDVVGRVGNTGWSTGPHLHFELHLNGTEAIDPYAWLTKYAGPARGGGVGTITGHHSHEHGAAAPGAGSGTHSTTPAPASDWALESQPTTAPGYEKAAQPAAGPAPAPEPGTAPVPSRTPVPGRTPEPSPTPDPSPTATPSPTPVPSPTPTPDPTPSPEPTPTPSPAPAPSPTPEPTPEPTPTPAPSPTAEVVPTPEPSPTAEPTPTPAPSVLPELAPLPDPNPTSEPSPVAN